MRRASRTVSCLLLIGLLAAACGGGATDTSPTSTADERTNTNTSENDVTETDTGVVITLTRSAFPEQVTVPPGGSVVWVNHSSAPHEVQIDTHDGSDVDMEPIRLGVDEQGEVNLQAGNWTYFCTIHPSMTGSLIVEG
jgi:plastocyanin